METNLAQRLGTPMQSWEFWSRLLRISLPFILVSFLLLVSWKGPSIPNRKGKPSKTSHLIKYNEWGLFSAPNIPNMNTSLVQPWNCTQ